MGSFRRLGTDGKWYNFKIAGTAPSPDELARMDRYLFKDAIPPEKKEAEGSVGLSDLYQAGKAGIGDLAGAAGYLFDAPKATQWGDDVRKEAAQAMSPAATQAEAEGVFGGGGIGALGLGAARSVPAMVGTLGATGAAMRFAPAQTLSRVGASLIPRVPGLAGVASRMAVKEGITAEAAVGKLIAGALSGSGTEGLISAGMSGEDAFNAIRLLAQEDPDTFKSSEIGAKYLAQFGGDYNKAADAAATDIARQTALLTGLTSAAVALPGAGVEAAFLGRGIRGGVGGAVRGALIGSGQEAGEEALQSGSERVYQNLALQQAGMDTPTFAGVGRSALEGAAVGVALGGGLGAVGGGLSSPLASYNERMKSLEEFNNGSKPAKQPVSDVASINNGTINNSRSVGLGRKDIGPYGSGVDGLARPAPGEFDPGIPFTTGAVASFSRPNPVQTSGVDFRMEGPRPEQLGTMGAATGQLDGRSAWQTSSAPMERLATEFQGIVPPVSGPQGQLSAQSISGESNISDGRVPNALKYERGLSNVLGIGSPALISGEAKASLLPSGQYAPNVQDRLETNGTAVGQMQQEPNAGRVQLKVDDPAVALVQGRFGQQPYTTPTIRTKVAGVKEGAGMPIGKGFSNGEQTFLESGQGTYTAASDVQSIAPSTPNRIIFTDPSSAAHAASSPFKMSPAGLTMVDGAGVDQPLTPILPYSNQPEVGKVPLFLSQNGDIYSATQGSVVDKTWEASPAYQAQSEVAKSNASKQVSAKASNEEISRALPELADRLKKKVRALGVPVGEVAFLDSLGGPEATASIENNKAVFRFALDTAPQTSAEELAQHLSAVMDHELIHGLFSMGLFSNSEQAKMLKFVRGTQYVGRDGTKHEFTWQEWADSTYRSVYENQIRGPELESAISEEAIAEAFRSWAKNHANTPGMMNGFFHRIINFLKGLAEAISQSGGERIFGKIVRGDMASRPQRPVKTYPKYSLAPNGGSPVFVSAVRRAVENSPLKTAPAMQWWNTLRNTAGVKVEELHDMELGSFLSGARPISREQLLDRIAAQDVQVNEIINERTTTEPRPIPGWKPAEKLGWSYIKTSLDGRYTVMEDGTLFGVFKNDLNNGTEKRLASADSWESAQKIAEEHALKDVVVTDTTRHNKPAYRTPGGENYRELLLTIPEQYGPWTETGHWNEPNVLAWARFDERTIDGKRTLWIDEIQSDWHQKGREHGYKESNSRIAEIEARAEEIQRLIDEIDYAPRSDKLDAEKTALSLEHSELLREYAALQHNQRQKVPSAPMRSTPTWASLVLKRMIRWAADNGFEQVMWTAGVHQNQRWNQSKIAKDLKWFPWNGTEGPVTMIRYTASNGSSHEFYVRPDGIVKSKNNIDDAETLEKVVGKEFAKMIKANPTGSYSKGGELFEIGGDGMRSFYDGVMVNEANKIGKKAGVKVEFHEDGHLLPINETLSTKALSGFDKYSLPTIYNIGARALPSPVSGQQRFIDISYAAAYDSIYNILDKTWNKSKLWKLSDNLPDHIPSEPVYNIFKKFQARSVPLARFLDDLNKSGAHIDEALNPMISWQLMRGKINKDKTIAIEKYRDPAIEALGALPFTEADRKALISHIKTIDEPWDPTDKNSKPPLSVQVEDLFADQRPLPVKMAMFYMHARHAPERNRYLKGKWGKDFDPQKNGSGLTDAEAAHILSWYVGHPGASQLNSAAELVSKMIGETNRINFESHLTPDWSTHPEALQFKHYVPLVGKADLDFSSAGLFDPAISVRGRETRKMYGRESLATNILEETIHRMQMAIHRANHNAMMNDFIDMLEQNKIDPAFGEILEHAPRTPASRKNGMGWVSLPTEADPLIVTAKNLREGEDGTQESYLRMVRLNPRYAALAHFLNGKDAQKPGDGNFIVKSLLWYNRTLGALVTRLNPEFMLSNLPRDIGTAVMNSQQYQGVEKTKVAKDAIAALKSILRHEWDKKYDDPYVQLYLRADAQGALNSDYGLDDPFESINRVVRAAGSKPGYAKQVFKKAEHWLSAANAAFENASRIAVMKNMLDAGYSERAALSAAKTITVNFDEGGTLRNAMNAGYLFYNASLQGTFGIFMAAARSNKVRKTVYGVMALGATMDTINRLISPEDDEGNNLYDQISDYIKEHNLIIMNPAGKNYIKIPLPYGYHSVYNFGRTVSDSVHRPDRILENSASVARATIEGFNPLGGMNSWLNFVSPTILDPFVDLSRNENFAGYSIYPEDSGFGPGSPKSQLYWNNTASAYNLVAELLRVPGTGTDKLPGMGLEVSPNEIQYLVETYAGGLGQLVSRVWNLGDTIVTGDTTDLEANDIPLARKLVGTVGGRSQKQAFYELRDRYEQFNAELADARADGEIERIRYQRENNPDMWANASRFKILNNRRNKLVKAARTIESSNLPEERKREQIDRLNKAADDLIKAMLALEKE